MLFLKILLVTCFALFSKESDRTLFVTSQVADRPQCLKVRDGDIRLGDLVQLTYPDKDIVEKLINSKVTLTQSELSQLNQSRLIEKVTEVLRSQSSFEVKGSRIVFEIEEVGLFQDCSWVNESYLKNLAFLSVLTKCPTCRLQSVSNLHYFKSQSRPTGSILSGKDNSQVTFIGGQAQTHFIPYEVLVLAPVLVTKSPIKKGQILEASQFEITQRVTSLGQLNYLVPVDFDLSDFQSTTSLPLSHVLKVTDLKKRDIVTIGQTLKAKWIGSFFEIEFLVIAKKSGSKSDIIPVQNVDTRKIFSAKILNSGEVEIIE